MCGIFGFVGNIPRETALECTGMLAHRGPDGYGLWEGHGITLGHRRLSILDLTEAGSQPMSGVDGRYCITYNGEIYNFLELRKELAEKGYKFFTGTDTEVLLASYSEWGEECQMKFNGMWAFAIWDSEEQALFISRDRFGKKPFFFHPCSSGFAFASEMKALFPVMREVRANMPLIRRSALDYHCIDYEQTGVTLIEGIERLPAGYCGRFHQGRLSLRRWWCTLDHIRSVPDRYEEQVDLFRELFVDACRLRMRSDVPVGTALSGGLDSSAVISVMSHIASSEADERTSHDCQHAFVACFPGTFLDERHYAAAVADHLGIKATYIDINPLDAISRMDNFIYLFEELYITSPFPFMLTYGAMKHENVKVTIDGHGADELFAGYTFDYIHALEDAGIDPKGIRSVMDAYMSSGNASGVIAEIRTFLGWHARNIARKAINRKCTSRDDGHPAWSRLDALSKVLYVSTHETILPTLLRNYDRYSMANGVEVRMPFLDHRIVCLASSLPWTSKVRNGFSKSIVRDAVAPFLPHEIAYRKSKIGFNTPFVEWLQGPLKGYFEDLLASDSFKQSEFVNAAAVTRQFKDIFNRTQVSFEEGILAWTTIMPYLWEQYFLLGWKKRLNH